MERNLDFNTIVDRKKYKLSEIRFCGETRNAKGFAPAVGGRYGF